MMAANGASLYPSAPAKRGNLRAGRQVSANLSGAGHDRFVAWFSRANNRSRRSFSALRACCSSAQAEAMRLTTTARAAWETECGGLDPGAIAADQTECIGKFLGEENIKRFQDRLQEALSSRNFTPVSYTHLRAHET